MKKLLLLACLILPTLSFAQTDEVSDSEWRLVEYNEIDFSAKAVDGVVEMEWSAFEGPDFEWYKVLRSNIEQNPIYPEVDAIGVKAEGELEFVDNNPLSKAYYRLCAITTTKARSCSNVVWVEVEPEMKVDTEKREDMQVANDVKKESAVAQIQEKIEKRQAVLDAKKQEAQAKNEAKKAERQEKVEEKKAEVQEKRTEKKEARVEQKFEKLKTWSDRIYTRMNGLDISNETKVKRVKRVQEKLFAWGNGNEARMEMVEFLDMQFNAWITEWEASSDLDSLDDLLEGLLED